MSLEEMGLSPRSIETEPEAPDMKLVRMQMEEAIKEEDYEQAAVLRDLINSGRGQGKLFKIEKRNLIDPTISGIYTFQEENPKHRAWKGIENLRQKSYWEGKERIEDYEFSRYLTSGPLTDGVLQDEDWRKIEKMRNVKGVEKVDFILNLRSKRDEIKQIIEFAKRKFNNLWNPYCEKVGLIGQEYEEFQSTYNQECQWSSKRAEKVLNKVPRDLSEPLHYWQRVYDNSRVIQDELNKALERLAQ